MIEVVPRRGTSIILQYSKILKKSSVPLGIQFDSKIIQDETLKIAWKFKGSPNIKNLKWFYSWSSNNMILKDFKKSQEIESFKKIENKK